MNSVYFHNFEKVDLCNTANLTKAGVAQGRTRECVPWARQGLTGFQTGIEIDECCFSIKIRLIYENRYASHIHASHTDFSAPYCAIILKQKNYPSY